MSAEKRKQVASLGGKTGNRNQFTSETASAAGKIGGKAKNPNKIVKLQGGQNEH
jgi:hypothetical protein